MRKIPILAVIIFSYFLLFSNSVQKAVAAPCDSFPAVAIEDTQIIVATVSELKDAVSNVEPHTTILIEDGIYELTSNLVIRKSHVTLRSRSGNRENVILDGGRWIGEPILILGAQHVSIVDLSIQNAYFHLIHLSGDADHFQAYNVRFIDSREQFLKVNADDGQVPDFGIVACSHFQLSSSGRTFLQDNPTPGFDCYTGGIDAHGTEGWHVRDSQFFDIYCTNGGLPEHCIHFWNGAKDTVVERNYIQNCTRGIGYGLGDSRGHQGGVIRNNMIWADLTDKGIGHDSGIGLESAQDVLVEHNTLYSAGTGFNAMIDMRFQTSGTVRYNLHFPDLKIRNGATAELVQNVFAKDIYFHDVAHGDLHITHDETVDLSEVIDAAALSEIQSDFDAGLRIGVPDIGADERGNVPDVFMPEPTNPKSCTDKSVKRKVKRKCRKRCLGKKKSCIKGCRKKRCKKLAS